MPVLVLAAAAALATASPPAIPCGPASTVEAATSAQPHACKLGDLPDAEMDLAVLRRVNGCSVREVVRFKVSVRGPAGPSVVVPTPGFRGRLVPDGQVQTLPTAR
jgi:hypothetical protein